MSGGTTMDSLVLIGSEISMTDSTTVTEELPDWLATNLRKHFDTNPIEDIVLLNVHEYVHTQQNTYGYDLLSQCLYEGVAEFVSVLSTGQPSSAPAIAFGQANKERVRERFEQELFSPNWDDWLYNNFENAFGVRDLGYYVGYAICEAYYQKTMDKKQAVKQMIEVDFGDSTAVKAFVTESTYFNSSLAQLRQTYEENRPEVVDILPFGNGAKAVDAAIQQINIRFSRPMSDRFGGFDPGPMGEAFNLPITGFVGLSEDGLTMTYKVSLEPGKTYQRQMNTRFRSEKGAALSPFLINFSTGK